MPDTQEINEFLLTVGSTFTWHEVNVPDVNKAIEFYTSVLGWTTKSMDMGPMGTYTMFCKGEVAMCGIMATVGEMAEVPPHWSTYINVDDVDSSVAKAEAAGGSCRVPAFDIPTVGRIALICDNQGAHFWLFKPEPN